MQGSCEREITRCFALVAELPGARMAACKRLSIRSSKGVLAVQIAHQLRAAESAIENANKALIHDRISDCIERPLKAADSAGRAPHEEMRLIVKYL